MKTFRDIFGGEPAAIATAPGRVNLLGEHTDYNDGFVLPAAISQTTTVSVRINEGRETNLYSADLDQRISFLPDEFPSQQFARYVYGCVREFSAHIGGTPALDIHTQSTVPIGVGLSSSAALEVAVLRALVQLHNASVDGVAIARMAQRAEIDYAGVNCGIMDQMAASLADCHSMLFLDCRTLDYKLLPLPHESEILVIDSGIARNLAASQYNLRRAECERAARALGLRALRDATSLTSLAGLPEPLGHRARHVVTENQRVQHAVESGDALSFGALMNISHASLRDDFEVSIPELDLLVQLLQQQPPVYGARLTGAGFGGACVALCHSGTARKVARDTLLQYNRAGRRGRLLVPLNQADWSQ
ncbi:MAG: galactokinase [Candidatus Binatia bacterium]